MPRCRQFALIISYCILTVFLLLPDQAFAQFNLEAGYSYALFQPKAMNEMVAEYESGRKDKSSSLARINGLHSLELGMVHHWEGFALGGFWSIRRDQNKSTYKSLDGITDLNESLTVGSYLFGLSAQANIGRLSIGCRAGYEGLTMKFAGNAETPDHTIKLNNGLASQYYLSYTLPGSDLLRIMIRPYYQLNLYNYDLADLASALSVGESEAKPGQFLGLSLIFANGPRPYHL